MIYKKMFFISFLVITSCAKNTEEKKDDRAIRSESDVLDVRISQQFPDGWYPEEDLAMVGFQNAYENRLLLYFPKVTSLYETDVSVSSITSVELRLNVNEVKVNPKNIKLYPVLKPWSPFATWNSRFLLDENENWDSPGGDYDTSIVSATPSIRRNTYLYELSFDITEMVLKMVSLGHPNYGFLLKVDASSLNAANEIGFLTYNNDNGQPLASLVFNSKDTIQ